MAFGALECADPCPSGCHPKTWTAGPPRFYWTVQPYHPTGGGMELSWLLWCEVQEFAHLLLCITSLIHPGQQLTAFQATLPSKGAGLCWLGVTPHAVIMSPNHLVPSLATQAAVPDWGQRCTVGQDLIDWHQGLSVTRRVICFSLSISSLTHLFATSVVAQVLASLNCCPTQHCWSIPVALWYSFIITRSISTPVASPLSAVHQQLLWTGVWPKWQEANDWSCIQWFLQKSTFGPLSCPMYCVQLE